MRAIKDEPELPDYVETLSGQKRKDKMEQEETNTWLDRKSKRLDAPGLNASSITSTPSATITAIQPTMLESLANDDDFETDNSLAMSVQNRLQTLEGQKTLRETLRKHLNR